MNSQQQRQTLLFKRQSLLPWILPHIILSPLDYHIPLNLLLAKYSSHGRWTLFVSFSQIQAHSLLFPQAPIFIVHIHKFDHSKYPRNVGEMNMQMSRWRKIVLSHPHVKTTRQRSSHEKCSLHHLHRIPSLLLLAGNCCTNVGIFRDLIGGGGQQKEAVVMTRQTPFPSLSNFLPLYVGSAFPADNWTKKRKEKELNVPFSNLQERKCFLIRKEESGFAMKILEPSHPLEFKESSSCF